MLNLSIPIDGDLKKLRHMAIAQSDTRDIVGLLAGKAQLEGLAERTRLPHRPGQISPVARAGQLQDDC